MVAWLVVVRPSSHTLSITAEGKQYVGYPIFTEHCYVQLVPLRSDPAAGQPLKSRR